MAHRLHTVSNLDDNHRGHSRSGTGSAAPKLHWHPDVDERQYVIDGDQPSTMSGFAWSLPGIEQLHSGDVGDIPQGYGHSIENVGD